MAESQTQNRKPTHCVIAALNRGTGKDPFYQKIGAGWESEKGTIWLNIEMLPTDLATSIGVRAVQPSDTDE